MRHPRLRNARIAALSAAATLVLACGLTLAQQAKPKAPADAPKGDDPPQRVSGVIVKVEEAAKGKEAKGARTVSINTDAVWREFARDQAPEKGRKVTKGDAAKGENSTSAKGQPESEDSLVKVLIFPDTKLEVRFRASDDETSAGSATPEGAIASEKEEPPPSDSGKAGKEQAPAKVAAKDIRKGLFIEVDYREKGEANHASRLVVIKPIGGPNTFDSEPGAEKKPAKGKGDKK